MRKTRELVHIIVGGKEIVSTLDHPYYVAGRGFVNACQLCIGSPLLDSDGKILEIEQIYKEQLEKNEEVTVYNFQVEDWHTYHVGEMEVLVHNAEYEGGLDTIIKNGKVSIDDIKTNPSAFSGKSAEEIADVLRNSGYDVTIKNSTRSRSGAQIIQINNSGGGKNISQVQVSPGGGRHGSNPYVKISTTDQGIIKIVDGIESTYKTDGKETATIIFSGGN